jgi:hypothetical protein
MLKVPSKNNLCIDDGGGWQTKLYLNTCNPNNINQHFEYNQYTRLIRNPSKNNMCVDDGYNNFYYLHPCDQNNRNQQFVYENGMFRNPNKNLCMDDGGVWRAAQADFYPGRCDVNNPNQQLQFVRI